MLKKIPALLIISILSAAFPCAALAASSHGSGARVVVTKAKKSKKSKKHKRSHAATQRRAAKKARHARKPAEERPGVVDPNGDIVPLSMSPVTPVAPRSLTHPQPGPGAVAVPAGDST